MNTMNMGGISCGSMYTDENQGVSIHAAALNVRLPGVRMHTYCHQALTEYTRTYSARILSVFIRTYACCHLEDTMPYICIVGAIARHSHNCLAWVSNSLSLCVWPWSTYWGRIG
eukprot:scaffold259399_cov31-Prasinocladus_malaysianus.AAC.1